MKLKKLTALLLCIALILSITGCDKKTKDEVKPVDQSSTQDSSQPSEDVKTEKIPITVLGRSEQTNDLNLIRDLLNKQGFDVKINMQPDRGAYTSQIDGGNFDIAFSGWAAISGNGDYATRSIFRTGGDYNQAPIEDSEIDALIDKAATVTYEESLPMYRQVEEILMDKAYIAPLYVGRKVEAFNKEVVNGDSIKIYAARAIPFEELDLADTSKRDTQMLTLWQAENYYTSGDPLKSNENSTYLTNFNMYTRLLNFNDKMEIVTDSSLSRAYSIGEGNQEFYFILRDDVNFAKVADKNTAADSGEMVGGEDVVFSLNRAKDKNSVPNHATYSLHENMDTVELVTDLSVLETAKESVTGKTVRESLEAGIGGEIKELVADKTQVSNADGKYQVVKIKAKTAFPQILNFLAHHSASILSKNQVEKINTFKVEDYDPNVDVCYGDEPTVTEGPAYDNQLYASGPYILLYRNDYEMVFQKNPNYMVGTEFEPKVKNISIKLIPDKDSALSALRSGEIHMLNVLDQSKDNIIAEDAKLEMKTQPGISCKYLIFNLRGNSVCSDLNIRKAIQNSMDQSAFAAVYNGTAYPVTTPLTPIMDTGYTFTPDPSKVQGYIQEYFKSK